MANENLFKAILELDVEFSKTSKGLDEVAKQYGKVNDVAEKNKLKLQELANEEAKLLEGRKKANNPSVVVRYNQELTKVQGQIKSLTAEQQKFTKAEKDSANEAQNLSKQLKNAFTTTQLQAMKKELKSLGVEFSSVSSGAKSFLKESQNVGKSIDAFKALKLEIKAAKGELAVAFASGNQEAIQKASDKVDDLKDSLTNLSQTGSKLERLPVLFGDITRNIFSLDFARANAQSKQLLATTKSITFAEAGKGIKDLGSTLLNLGKSLLLNPIFLLGGAIFAIIANFDKLKSSGGAIGGFFRGVGDVIDALKETFFALTDAIGLTSHALDEFNEKQLSKLKKQSEENVKALDRFAKILRAQGKDTDDVEKAKAKSIQEGADKQIKILRGIQKEKGILSEDEQKQLDEALEASVEASNELIVIEQTALTKRREQAKKYAESTAKIFEDLEKRIRAEQVKTSEFQIKTLFGEGTKEQLEATFNLRKHLEQEAFKETEKTTLKELKTKADIEKAKAQLTKLRTQQELNFENDKTLATISIEEQIARDKLNLELENELRLVELSNDTESGKADQKISINTDYYAKLLKLDQEYINKRKALGFDTTAEEKRLQDNLLKAQEVTKKGFEEQNKLNTDNAIKEAELKESQADTQLKLQNARHSTELDNELKFERDKLAILDAGGKAYTEEYKRQADKVALIEKEAIKQRRLENIGYYEQLSQAVLSATNKVIDTKLKEIEALSNLQQKRVDDAKGIADQGNAELLELEKERLDNLNKEKEKFVRAQQALAVVELISNTAIAVSKAAAQGGVAAGITIAATLLALVAGLASARSIASQAAFYDGGYTGDGNPRETSTKLGKKNYTYHKGEFVFDHEKTGKYRSIFEDVHAGRVDLGEMKDKARMFDYFKSLSSMNTQVPMFMPPSVVNNTVEVKELKNQMEQLIVAVRNQQTNVSLDKRGFAMSLKNVIDRDNFLSKEAKA